jgi:simple sugar transport system permease protein
MITHILQTVLSLEFIAASVRAASPIAGAAVGETVAERGGVLNIGLEGMMLTGAFFAVLGSMLTGNPWAGAALAAFAGGCVGLLHAFVSLTLKADQILSGIAINFAALGLTTFLNRTVFGPSPDPVQAFETWPIPLLSRIPFLGELFFNQDPVVYLLYLAAPFSWVFLFKTRSGLRLRAIGEDPRVAAGAAIPVLRYQYAATVFCGAMAGLAGTYSSLGNVRYFTENMTAGTGFIALAVVIAGRWNPLLVVAVSLLFGGVWSLALRGQAFSDILPYELLLMLPYVLTLVAYFIMGGGTRVMPASLGKPANER